MSDREQPAGTPKPPETREERLARALRENLRRRKAPPRPKPSDSGEPA